MFSFDCACWIKLRTQGAKKITLHCHSISSITLRVLNVHKKEGEWENECFFFFFVNWSENSFLVLLPESAIRHALYPALSQSVCAMPFKNSTWLNFWSNYFELNKHPPASAAAAAPLPLEFPAFAHATSSSHPPPLILDTFNSRARQIFKFTFSILNSHTIVVVVFFSSIKKKSCENLYNLKWKSISFFLCLSAVAFARSRSTEGKRSRRGWKCFSVVEKKKKNFFFPLVAMASGGRSGEGGGGLQGKSDSIFF